MNALDVIKSGYRRCNRLSPGETLNADDIARGMEELVDIVDELNSKNRFLFKTTFTSAAQTGNITLGAGSWTALVPGIAIFGVFVDNSPIDYTTPDRFASINDPSLTGIPRTWTYDGYSLVSMYPLPAGETVKLETGSTVASFADETTQYVVPPGYRAYLGARLAKKLHPIIARLTSEEIRELTIEERRCESAIQEVSPAIIDGRQYSRTPDGSTVISNPYGW